jgi:hypothetical protein
MFLALFFFLSLRNGLSGLRRDRRGKASDLRE